MPHAVRSRYASEPRKPRRPSLAPWVLAGTLCLACGSSPRPSILLAVLDTTRVDAVSAYGQVEGTTPRIDALAASGLRYTQAYSQANWTLPSHASLFVGLLPSQHGAVSFTTPLDESFLTLAERLREHGYETVGVNENPWVGDPVRGFTQGFDRFVTIENRFSRLFRESSGPRESPSAGVGFHGSTAEAVEQWLAGRSADRPFFLFLNIMDAHSPYKVRPANPHLPSGVTAGEARAVSQRVRDHLCQTPRRSRPMEILWGLYLGGVNAADRKLGRVLELLRQAGADENLIIVATSDHGEHLGERRRFLHDIGVLQPLIHVPLVVHGLPEVSPAVIDAPVQLLDLLPSILAWVGAEADAGLPGRRLPTRSKGAEEPRVIVSEYVDPLLAEPPEFLRQGIARTRQACGPADKVSGDARSALRWPHKLVWYERHADELYDLRADPSEWRDTAKEAPDLAAELQAALPPPYSPRPGLAGDTPHPPPDPAFLAKLRALGYLDDSEAHEATSDGAGER